MIEGGRRGASGSRSRSSSRSGGGGVVDSL
jgi:hypothetical protein